MEEFKMKKVVFVSVIALLSSMLIGCASLPSVQVMEAEVKDFSHPKTADKNNTVVYIVRPEWGAPIIKFNVFLDDKEDSSEMGFTKGEQYIYFTVTPGNHIIYSKAENWAEIPIVAEKGKYVFIKQTPKMGIIMARNEIQIISDTEGKYHVKKTKPGTIIKQKK
jgi:hypothetical protein